MRTWVYPNFYYNLTKQYERKNNNLMKIILCAGFEVTPGDEGEEVCYFLDSLHFRAVGVDHKKSFFKSNLFQPLHLKSLTKIFLTWEWEIHPNMDVSIYWVFLLFQFGDSYLEVPLTIMNMYHLELTPESYNLKFLMLFSTTIGKKFLIPIVAFDYI